MSHIQPKVLITKNYNAIGAHNELLPNNEGPKGPQGTTCPYKSEPSKLIKHVKKNIIHQRQTKYDDLNIAKNTPLHPPYMNYYNEHIQGASNNVL